VDIRPIRPDELQPAIAAIRDGGWGDRAAELGFYVRDSGMTVLVADEDGSIVGTTVVSASAGVGWIGLVFVAPSMRGRGLGSRLTRAGLAQLSECRTVLLAASDMGRPIYERLGFEVEGRYAIMRGPGGGASPRARAITAQDRERIRQLDRAATGEDRAHLLDALPHGWIAQRGFALCTPWGYGPAIAEDAASGEAVLDAMRAHADTELTLRVPTANAAAMQYLQSRGFREGGSLPRMRLGDPVPWRPERIWAITNFALG
jgi:predicted N-acetyltransferase YhbS